MSKALVSPCLLVAFLLATLTAQAHPGHDHPPGHRVWKDAEGLFEIEAAFVVAKDDEVQLRKHDRSLVWIPLDKLSRDDQEWVRRRLTEIGSLNQAETMPPTEAAPLDERGVASPIVLVALVGGMGLIAALGVWLKRTRTLSLPAFACLLSAASLAALAADEKTADKKASPAMRTHFEPFEDKLELRHDDDYLYIGSDGLPDHRMMVGIKAWQQQVPLPQPYTGKNAWRIPLAPVLAKKPISAKKALYRGAIALAVNGVPIFNALNNRGEDAYLAGELDEFGGHCGRGDDYHYHIAPVHLEKVAGKGKPIAYALDGFPLYGYTDADGKEPRDLDEFNGRMEKGSYRYYSTRKYPYINGGMRGVVTVRGDQIDPQPRDAPVRPAGRPLRGAKITDFVRDKQTSTLKYDLRGKTYSIKYTMNKDGTFTFVYTDADGERTTETHRRREKGKDKGKPKKDERE